MSRRTVSVLTAVMAAAKLAHAEFTETDVRSAAQRALVLLQEGQKNWKVDCHSCHHQTLPAMAYRDARSRGIPIDEAIAKADAVKAFAPGTLDEAVQFEAVVETTMDQALEMVAARATGLEPNLVLQVWARMVALRQQPEGLWRDFHQRPPQSHSNFTQTSLGLRALQIYSHASQKADVAARIARARNWLQASRPLDTAELAWQLIGLGWADSDGSTAAFRSAQASALLKMQRKDGGWGWMEGRESDAYSTAEVLIALHEHGGISASSTAWRNGIEYLLKTQKPDGTWHVATRLHPPAQVSPPYFDSGYPYGRDQYISASAASLAVTALSMAIGPASIPGSLSWKQDLEPIEPWAETVLFGSVVDLKRLLDDGFDPNSATKSGGTTALMMAVSDVEKVKLLLGRGAKVNALTKSGSSALLVASKIREGNPSVRLLLESGADPRLTPTNAARQRRSPLNEAVRIGNAEILAPLLKAGDQFETAITMRDAIRSGHAEVVRIALELGVPVDGVETSGVTPLDRAAIGNHIEIAKILIDRGAAVNHVDRRGFTPLLYAASIDWGDSAMIELLLKSGARRDLAAKDGQTPLDLARKYGHQHFVSLLSADLQ